MLINPELCSGCGICVDYCPVDAIHTDKKTKHTYIDLDECVECGSCLRVNVCPKGGIYQQELVWPRAIRSSLSDPLTITPESGIAGRGTEEMKTNDVTGRFKHGEVGIGIEVGRPVLGASMRDVEKIAMAMGDFGVEFETCNPLTTLMSDIKTGKFKEDVLNERVLSAIIEFVVPLDQMNEVLKALEEVAKKIDTVFSVCLATRVDEESNIVTKDLLDEAGYWYAPNGKTNLGLGRPLFKEI